MDKPFLSRNLYLFLFSLLGMAYLFGLFVPLMDNDSAHHANIALHMYLTYDYVSLVDHAGDYLDKPHLHFWLAAFSYKLFGVTTFAYKFPSFLFSIAGIYSTYRLGKALYDKETGKLAALMLASAFAFMLANNDVRMDAILTSCIAFSTWQLVAFIQHKKISNVAGAALGLALGFSTKGHIGVFVPAIAALFYILYRQEWKLFLHWKWLLLLVLFGIFITPVVYCFYLQYNLHPEITVRGKDHIDGVQFILFNQSVERFSGQMGNDAKHDYLFFIHSFCWAFAPWSIISFWAMGGRLKNFLQRKEEWLTTGVFISMLLIVSFSGFKLPHYLNIVFPATAVFTASFIMNSREDPKRMRTVFIIQRVITVLVLLLLVLMNSWFFPVRSVAIMAGAVVFLAVLFYFLKSSRYTLLQKAVTGSASLMALAFFLLNSNFYPQLLTYQGGNQLAFTTRGIIDPANVYAWKESQSSSYFFYTKTLRRPFTDSALQQYKTVGLLYYINDEPEILKEGYRISKRQVVTDFEVTKLGIKFLNPATREKDCTRMVLAEISKP